MKKNFILLVLMVILLMTGTIYSRKSDFLLSFKTGINSLVGDRAADYSLGYNASLNFEYFFKDNLSASFGLGYNFFNGKKIDNGDWWIEQHIFDYSLNIGIRYYFNDYQKKITPYIGLDGSYLLFSHKGDLKGNYPSQYDPSLSETMGVQGISPILGILYPVSRSFHLSLTGKYTITFNNQSNYAGYAVSVFTDYNFWSFQLGFCFVL